MANTSNLTVVSSSSPLKRIIHAIKAVETGEYTADLLSDIAKDSGGPRTVGAHARCNGPWCYIP